MINLLTQILFLGLISSNAFALNQNEFPIAKVIALKGDVTALPPHSLAAKKIQVGDMLLKDTSLLVNGAGFARIKFINDSLVILGPNSKINIEMNTQDKTSLINLMTGKVRAMVKKENDQRPSDKKFLVKNQAAIMGVRGTDFQVTYNPKSKRSALLTFDGRVDIAKNIVPAKIENKVSTDQNIQEIKKALAEKFEPVVKGDFANVAQTSQELAPPVKINAAQFVLLKKDESLGAEKIVLDQKEKESIQQEVKALKVEFNEDIEKRKERQEVRELGLVDTNSGFYVPPADDEMTKLIGEIEDNGAYIPPQGVEIDDKKGLVIKEDAPKEVVKLVKEVQKQMEKQVVEEEEMDPSYNRYLKQ